jgi:coenzyme F420-reducing hydrogenase alpha subunit
MTKKKDKSKIIKVDTLARVEGEGALYIKIKGDSVEDVRLKIFEPPRFFEAFLRGRDYKEVPDITARICGICPVAYQMSSVHAMEDALGVKVDGPLRELRRLIYCGEWIESHVLHIYMLHAPDFLGFDDAIQMAKKHGDIVERGLKLKKAGNDLMNRIGGREIHPINIRIGGFYKVFRKLELADIEEQLKWAMEAAIETAKWAATFPFPEMQQDFEFVALRHSDEYPLNEGRLVSSSGLDIDIADFDDHIQEEHVEHSNALHAKLKGRGTYLVGPLARFNLNFDRLSPVAKEVAKQTGVAEGCRNPFKSILVRSIEVIYACEEALRILQNYTIPDRPYIETQTKAGTGHGCTEAPRGTLYHQYTIDDAGKVLNARIVPPTSQNQKSIENDLLSFVQSHLDLPEPELTWKCEQTIRNYDPCISCATHFLKLEIDRK